MRVACALWCVLCLAGCSDDGGDAPPFIDQTCRGSCSGPRSGGTVTDPPASGEADAGVTVPSDAGVFTLSANVWALQESSFASRQSFPAAGTLAVRGAGATASVEFTGATAEVPSVVPTRPLWVAVTPSDGAFLTTLQAVAGLSASVPASVPRDVDVVRLSAVEDALGSATIQATGLRPEYDPARAQIVVSFLDANDLPVSGVQIQQNSGQVVLYDDGGTYTDVVGATQGLGKALVVNATVGTSGAQSGFPGTTSTLTFKAGQALASFEVLAVAGGVTLVNVQVGATTSP